MRRTPSVSRFPTTHAGLRFICRESVDYGRSHFDHPLGSRFEEMDAVVVFDDVFVPWENVFLYRDIKRCNEAYARTGAIVHMTHQVVVKNIAKSEFMLGLASLMVNTIGVESFQHIHEKLAEIWVNLETMKAFLRTAEADAQLDEWGVMRPAWNPLDAARNLFPRLYPRMVEIIQQIGASGLVAMPTAQDLNGPVGRATSGSTTRRRGRRHSIASRCSGLPGTHRSPRSPDARYYTSASSSAIRYAWPERWSRVTPDKFKSTPRKFERSSKKARTKHSRRMPPIGQ